MDKIAPLSLVVPDALRVAGSALRPNAEAGSFAGKLKEALQTVSAEQNRADELQRRFQYGESGVSLEETMLATQTANVSFQALVQVRNRLLSAYHDIMNMQV